MLSRCPKLQNLAKLEHVQTCDTQLLTVTLVQEPHIDYSNSHEMPEENQVSASALVVNLHSAMDETNVSTPPIEALNSLMKYDQFR